MPLGELSKGSGPKVDDGIYNAIIERAEVVRNAAGDLVTNDNGKNQIDVYFRISKDITLKRKYSISFAKNPKNNSYSVFSKFVAAATGIPCGDEAQKALEPEDFHGKKVRIQVLNSADGFVNVESVMPPPKDTKGRANAEPVNEPDSGDDSFEGGFPDEIPF